MAGTTVHMHAQKSHSLQEIHEKLHYVEGAELVSKFEQTVNNVTICTLVYEKYYFRTGSYASAAIVLTEFGADQTACIVSSGGGTGIVNHSLGANRKFAKECMQALTSCGFDVVEAVPDPADQSFAARFFK